MENNNEIIVKVIEATRLHLLNTALCIVDNQDEAIKIIENTYIRLIEEEIPQKDLIESLNNLLYEEASKYLKVEIKSTKEKVKDEFKLENIDIEQYKEYYNNPKVEAIVHKTINSLPSEEKEIVIQSYFLNKSISEIASSYNVSEETINNYLNKANKLINNQADSLFKANKINLVDFNAVSTIYSVIKLGIGIATFDVIGITVDVVKDFVEKKVNDGKDKEDKNIKSFSKDVVEDLVQDWCLERITSYSIVTAGTTSVAAVGAKTAVAATAVKAATASKIAGGVIVKKFLIAMVATTITAGGGYIAYEVITEEKPQEIIEKQKESKKAMTATVTYVDGTSNALIEIFTDKDNVIDYINVNLDLIPSYYESLNLGALEAASKVVSGITVEKTICEDKVKVTIYVIKAKVDKNVVSLIKKYVQEDYGTINDIVALLELDIGDLSAYLSNNGYKVNYD